MELRTVPVKGHNPSCLCGRKYIVHLRNGGFEGALLTGRTLGLTRVPAHLVLRKDDLTGEAVVGVRDGVAQDADAPHDLQREGGVEGRGRGGWRGRSILTGLPLHLPPRERETHLSNLLHSIREVVR